MPRRPAKPPHANPTDSSNDAPAPEWRNLDARKAASTGQLLLKAARLLDERALERVNQAARAAAAGIKTPVRPAHTSLFPHIAQEGTRLTVLAERLGITKQAVQWLVDDLEESGVLERVPDPTDGRAKLVRFTPKGRAAIQHGLGVLAEIERDLEQRVGQADMQALRRALPIIVAALDRPPEAH